MTCHRGEPDPAWLAAERRKYSSLSGEAFDAFYPAAPEAAFVGREGLVYGVDAVSGVRVLDPKRNICAPSVRWADCKWRLAIHDPGGSDPSAILLLGVAPDERMAVYGEHCIKGAMSAMDVSNWLSVPEERGHIDIVFVDPSQASMIASLRQLGWNAHPANNSKLEGIGVVKRMLLDGRLTIPPECKQLIYQLGTYWWPTRKHLQAGGNPSDTRTAADHHADLPDCLRYAVLGVFKGLPRHSGRMEQQWDSGVSDRQNRPESFRERLARKRA